jgi:hypothetical protein
MRMRDEFSAMLGGGDMDLFLGWMFVRMLINLAANWKRTVEWGLTMKIKTQST